MGSVWYPNLSHIATTDRQARVTQTCQLNSTNGHISQKSNFYFSTHHQACGRGGGKGEDVYRRPKCAGHLVAAMGAMMIKRCVQFNHHDNQTSRLKCIRDKYDTILVFIASKILVHSPKTRIWGKGSGELQTNWKIGQMNRPGLLLRHSRMPTSTVCYVIGRLIVDNAQSVEIARCTAMVRVPLGVLTRPRRGDVEIAVHRGRDENSFW
ncbi:unnamed protein product [Protopolystoma xenopodis]|uniref:Uncharacterized protein n=1 Tax=Protopolystoma xenopodis TaxID=117903 RepID=A0A448XLB6_9PLAT|nr:unnamed protein product [Protopolystoma xenopodis]